MTAKILHVQPCSALNIPGVAESTEQHKVLGRRVLLLPLAWLLDPWRRWRYPSVAPQLPPHQHTRHAGCAAARPAWHTGGTQAETQRDSNLKP